jgi:Ca-activated chloride channel family protein
MTRAIAVSSALVLGVLFAVPAAQQQTVFRGASDIVRVFVTVTDRDDRLVTTLTREQFELRDEGKPQEIVLFDNTPQPIQLVVMLDVSGSMIGNLPLLRAASQQLFLRLRPDDVVRVGTFGDDVAISEEFTNDQHALMATLPTEIPPNAPTPLWRGLDEAIDALDPASERRRVVLVLSDGKDSGPTSFTRRIVSQGQIMDRARDENVMVYAVGMRSRGGMMPRPGIGAAGLSAMMTADLPDPGLARVATESGGGYLEIGPRDDLRAAVARVADELHSQYLLGFLPPKRDGKEHDLDVRVSARGLEPRARKSYVAPKDSGTPPSDRR